MYFLTVLDDKVSKSLLTTRGGMFLSRREGRGNKGGLAVGRQGHGKSSSKKEGWAEALPIPLTVRCHLQGTEHMSHDTCMCLLFIVLSPHWNVSSPKAVDNSI